MLGPDHTDTLTSVNNLAELYRAQGRHSEAEPLFKRALTARERLLGPEHPQTLISVNALASLYQAQGRYSEAEQLYRRALAARERVLGPEHADTLMSVNDLALLYKAQGRYALAEPLYKRALAGCERTLGQEHTQTLITAGNLASLYQTLSRYVEAEPLEKRVLAVRERVLGPDHPDTLMSVNNLAELYREQGRYSEAEPLHKRALTAFERTLGPDHPNTLTSASNLALLYYQQGRYNEAEQLYKRGLAALERVLGPDHPSTLTSVNSLAGLYQDQGRYAEAEQLLKRALKARERVLGPEHPDALGSVNNLANLYAHEGRYSDAEPLYRRVLAVRERVLGPEHADTLTGLNNLALLYKSQGRYAQAEPLYKRALEGCERVLGPEHPLTILSMGNLASFYVDQGRFAQAEPLDKRALAVRERVLGPDHPDTLTSVNNLAELYRVQGRYDEAEPLYKRALATLERVLGPDHPDTLISVNNLALFYNTQGRRSEAEPLVKRALASLERVLGPDHPSTLTSVNNLASLYWDQGRNNEAEPLLKRALAANERQLGPDHPATLTSGNNLAELYKTQERYAEAEPLFKRVLAARERVLGPDHPSTLTSLDNLAGLYQNQRRYAQAGLLYKRALSASERVLGSEHPQTLSTANELAGLYYEQQDWAHAAELWRRNTAAIAGRVQRGAQSTGQPLLGKKKSEAEREKWQFENLVKVVHRLAPNAKDARETFETAQWAQSSEAAASLAQMAARGATGDPALASLVRERQDLLDEWQKRDARRNAALGQEAAKRDPQAEAENGARLSAIDARIKEIDRELAAKFPDYAVLTNPAPLAAEQVQALLGPDEALVLFLETEEGNGAPEETFIWVVTKTDMRWVRSDWGAPMVPIAVQYLRCGLDDAAWEDENCSPFVALSYTDADRAAGKPLPFDLALSNELYRELFGQAEDLIKGKQLLIVPSGSLAQLPFQTLVTALPADAVSSQTPSEVSWLGALAKNLTPAERQALKLPEGRGTRIVNAFSEGPAAEAGLKPGDILLSFEGKDFGEFRKLTEAIRTYPPDSKVQFRVSRNGAEFTAAVTLGRNELQVPRPLAPGDKNIAWLIREHALTVLPAVSSLKALRRVARPSAASKPMIGFGNPLLDAHLLLNGNPEHDAAIKTRVQSAAENQRCTDTPSQRVAALTGEHRGLAPLGMRGGLADLEFLRGQNPLPETAQELCEVARDLSADGDEIRLGARATEREVKHLSETGQLAQYRAVHFATHGALAGQVQGSAEPGLLLTPPQAASEEDDGYLTAPEIAGLKLDADWVILSACNTAAGGAQGAEALSGLARAFIYAQARALLVSHWEVDTDAAVKLITGAMKRLAADKRMGRAEAMRQSMLALIDGGEPQEAHPQEAHPAFWAPFVLVGEGGAAK